MMHKQHNYWKLDVCLWDYVMIEVDVLVQKDCLQNSVIDGKIIDDLESCKCQVKLNKNVNLQRFRRVNISLHELK